MWFGCVLLLINRKYHEHIGLFMVGFCFLSKLQTSNCPNKDCVRAAKNHADDDFETLKTRLIHTELFIFFRSYRLRRHHETLQLVQHFLYSYLTHSTHLHRTAIAKASSTRAQSASEPIAARRKWPDERATRCSRFGCWDDDRWSSKVVGIGSNVTQIDKVSKVAVALCA